MVLLLAALANFPARADSDPVVSAVAAMVAAPDAAGREQVLHAVMGKAVLQTERQALGQLRAYLEALEAAMLDDEQVRVALESFSLRPSERDQLLREARQPPGGGGVGEPASPGSGAGAGAGGALPSQPPLSRLPYGAEPRTDADELRLLFARLAAAPDPAAAAVLSTTVGFGAGHFYARQPGTGWAFLGVQAAAGGTLAAGLASTREGEWTALATAGLVALVLARGIDVAAAPGSAHRTAADAFR